jgi:hypothetical protein
MKLVGAVIILGVLAGCAAIQNGTRALSNDRQRFNGQLYSAKVQADATRPELFVVAVGNLDRGLEGAVEAGRYEAYTYCLNRFGLTDIRWALGPDAPRQSLRITDGRLTLQGECVGWV